MTYGIFNRNIFIRPHNFERNRLIGPSGQEVPGDRVLSYFIAHEVTHALLSEHLGRWRYAQLAAWQDDGYCDYVAKGRGFDFESTRQRFKEGARELDPQLSGLYLKYHLLVSYLLDHRGMTVDQMLALPSETRTIESVLRQ